MNLERIRKRLEGKIRRVKSGCWLIGVGPGYPIIKVAGSPRQCRRLAWLVWRKDEPLEGRTLRTTCGNINCVNPDHLVLARGHSLAKGDY